MWHDIVAAGLSGAAMVFAAIAAAYSGYKPLVKRASNGQAEQVGKVVVLALQEAFDARRRGIDAGQGGTGMDGLAAPAYYPLTALPQWSQRLGVLPDGQPDPQANNDCGETCVAMVVAAVHGVPVEAGWVRQVIGGYQRSGLTDAGALVEALTYFNVAAGAQAPAVASLNGYLAARVRQQVPTIALGCWDDPSVLHWVIVAGDAGPSWVVIDPWDGTRAVYGKTEFAQRYAGSLVAVTGRCHYDMSRVPTPGS